MDTIEYGPESLSCLRWREGRTIWRHAHEVLFRPTDYEVAPIEDSVAKAFVECHHYSGAYPSARLRYGLYSGDLLVGVAVFSVPVRKEVLSTPFPYLEPYYETLELGRFVLLDAVPANSESWFLARCFELARATGLKGVVSFADPVARIDRSGTVTFRGHRGIIYQASNAIYAGRATARYLTILPDGKPLNDRTAQKLRADEQGAQYTEQRLRLCGASQRVKGEDGGIYLKRALNEIGAIRFRHGGCHRYLFPLGSGREKRSIHLGFARQPYPKALELVA